MKKILAGLMIFALAAAPAAFAKDKDPNLVMAKELQKNSERQLKQLEKAFHKKDIMRAREVGASYGQTILKLDEVAAELRNEGRLDDVKKIEKRMSDVTIEHQAVLNRVRDQVPGEAQAGIDRALQVSLRVTKEYAN